MDVDWMTLVYIVLGIIVLWLFFTYIPVGLWVQAFASGLRVPLTNLIGMRLRRVNPAQIIYPAISATKAGIRIPLNELESHLLAGGNVGRVVPASVPSLFQTWVGP